MTRVVITVGGALVGLLCATWVIWPWWKKGSAAASASKMVKPGAGAGGKGRDWRALMPFFFALCIGVMSATCVGGILGTIAHRIGGASNTGGNWLLSWLAGSQSPTVTRPSLTMLQPGGAVVLILFVFILGLWLRSTGGKQKQHLILGIICGCTLGPTAGLAGLAGKFLVPFANMAGAKIVGLI